MKILAKLTFFIDGERGDAGMCFFKNGLLSLIIIRNKHVYSF